MKIYGSSAGGNPIRVAFFLAEKGVDVEFVPVDLMAGEHRSEQFRAVNPFCQVPVLELGDGSFISETMAICRYFERLYPEPNLMGSDPVDEATIEMWQRRVEFDLYMPARAVFRHSSPYVKALEPVQIAAWAELNRPRVNDALVLVNQRLAESRFVAGDRYTVADITLLFCTQMLQYIEISPIQAGEHVERWYGEVSLRPSVQKILGQGHSG